MNPMLLNLDPSTEYSFQTSPSGRTLPITVKQFLNCRQAGEDLITIDGDFGPGSVNIWSTYDGWCESSFAKLVLDFVAIIDQSQEPGSAFIQGALSQGLSVPEAVSKWFIAQPISVDIMHHAEGTTGLIDVSIEGVSSARRAVFSMAIQKGECFNVYYGDGSKGSAVWHTDLLSSLTSFFLSNQTAQPLVLSNSLITE